MKTIHINMLYDFYTNFKAPSITIAAVVWIQFFHLFFCLFFAKKLYKLFILTLKSFVIESNQMLFIMTL